MADLQTVLQLLPEIHEMSDDALTCFIRDNFSGSLLSLKQLKPWIEERLRRFKRLPRKRNVDGSYPNIDGYRSFNPIPVKCLKCRCIEYKHKDANHAFEADPKTGSVGWCKGVLNRDARTARYMLNGGNPKSKSKGKGRAESISSTDASAILKYVDKRLSNLDAIQQKLLAQGLSEVLGRLKNSKRRN